MYEKYILCYNRLSPLYLFIISLQPTFRKLTIADTQYMHLQMKLNDFFLFHPYTTSTYMYKRTAHSLKESDVIF